MSEHIKKFKRILKIVKLAEETNTRSANVDYVARMFFVEHGAELLDELIAAFSAASVLIDDMAAHEGAEGFSDSTREYMAAYDKACEAAGLLD